MRKASSADLLFVSKSPKDRLDHLAAGASLVKRTGYQVGELRHKAAHDRLQLALVFLREAKAINGDASRLKRTVISRAYYAMYHALRAVVFISHGGDDHEQHTVLPSKLPNDFPDSLRWQNSLKGARLERNRADYDPYPRDDAQFGKVARQLIVDAEELVSVARQYVRAKL